MGGVRTDYTGQSPTPKGLFAAGEAACQHMHGFDRLGGKSVAATGVDGISGKKDSVNRELPRHYLICY